MTYTRPENPPRTKASTDEVTVRPYEPQDYVQCREIFTEGMQQLINPVMEIVFPRYAKLSLFFAIFVAAAAFRWSLWIVVLYFVACIVLTALLYINIYLEVMKFISNCLSTDLRDIDKFYMFNKGCCMWVAEYNGRVVGMVGVVKNDSQGDGVVELQRMSVSSTIRRKGIAGKLIRELLLFAREQNYKKVILSTTGAQKPAISLYQKWGFKLVSIFPFPQRVLQELSVRFFALEL